MLVHVIDTAFMSVPKRVGVAVSGGGDSMALLHAAHRWSGLSGVPIEAVTVDHGLRIHAAREAGMVAEVCAAWGITHSILNWDGTKATGNIAAAGRDARYDLIAKWAKRNKIGGVLLGHTKDDIAETFLMRLARKSGVDGLAMMDLRFDRQGMQWARPFWQQGRAELRDYLRRNDVGWVDDPTNEDETYDRPKARKILAGLAPLGITADTLKSVAASQAMSRDALKSATLDAARRSELTPAGDLVLDGDDPIPYEIKRRLWRAALQYLGGGDYPPREQALFDLETTLQADGKATLAGCVVTKNKREIRFSREQKPLRDVSCSVEDIWDRRWQVERTNGAAMPGDLHVRALGQAIKDVPDWRDTGLPRASLMATPGVFDGDTLIAAPVAGYKAGYEARIVADFVSFLLSR